VAPWAPDPGLPGSGSTAAWPASDVSVFVPKTDRVDVIGVDNGIPDLALDYIVEAECSGLKHGRASYRLSPQGSDRSLVGAQKGCGTKWRTGFIKPER
jgi:hypothetical protein